MAILTGNNGVIKIDGSVGGSLVTVLGVRNFSVDMTADTIEKTVMGNDTRQYLKGLSTWSGSADVYLDDAHMTGGASAIASLIATSGTVGEASVTVELYLNSTANKFSGEAIITGFTVNSSMDGMVEASISFQGTGSATYTA
jgi:predicted secreted protein